MPKAPTGIGKFKWHWNFRTFSTQQSWNVMMEKSSKCEKPQHFCTFSSSLLIFLFRTSTGTNCCVTCQIYRLWELYRSNRPLRLDSEALARAGLIITSLETQWWNQATEVLWKPNRSISGEKMASLKWEEIAFGLGLKWFKVCGVIPQYEITGLGLINQA